MSQPVLTSLPELDDLRSSNHTIFREGNVDVVRVPPETDVAFCHLPYIMPFTVVSNGERDVFNAIGTYEGAASVALAAQHLNAGDGSIVPDLEGLNETCNIRFTLEMHDTELSERVAVDQIIHITDREPGRELVPCAIIGAARSAVSMPTSIISGLRGYPQVSAISTSSSLDDTSQYPLFARTIPADDGTAVPVILYLRNELNVKHLAVVHVSDSYGNAYARGLQLAATKFAPDMKIETFDMPFDATLEVVERTVGFLKDTRYMYIFAIIFPTENFDMLMTEAVKQGVAGTGRHNWMFSDSTGSDITSRAFQKGSPLHLASRGAGLISAVGGLPGMPTFDKLVRALKDINNEQDIEYLKSKLPSYTDAAEGEDIHASILNREDFLDKPGLMGPFLYDATVALGLAACNATSSNSGGAYYDGETHFSQLLVTSFEGTSGTVVFNAATGTRDPQSALFSLSNFVEDITHEGTDTVQFRAVQTDVFRSGVWIQLEQYTFNDGTSNVSPDLPYLDVNENHISAGWRAAGLLFCAIVLALSAGFAAWTTWNRKCRVVKASQPIFLHIICAGAFIMGSAIIPLSIDRGIASNHGCDISCMSVPWLLSIGFSVAFSALFTKTYRVNKIFHNPQRFRRIKVTAFDVAKPMIATVGANILILSLWTGFSPLQWEVEIISTDDFDRSSEIRGFCHSDQATPYLTTLCIIDIGSLLFAMRQAYVARDVSTEYAESEYIFKAVVSIALVCFIGIPVLVIAHDNPEAYFFVFSFVIFVSCTSILLLIFAPKIKYHRKKRKKTRSSQEDTTSSGHGRSQVPLSSSFHTQSSERSDDSETDGLRVLNDPKTREALTKEIKHLRRRLTLVRNESSRDIEPNMDAGNGSARQLSSSRISDVESDDERGDEFVDKQRHSHEHVSFVDPESSNIEKA